jgi:glycosyltransferase involved in cell wall biosynthesis
MKFYLVENGIKELSLSEELPKVCNEIQGFSNNFNKKVLISVGRLDENKNQKMLIDVFNKPNFNNAILVIIGEDPSPDKSYLNNLKNECNKNVFILGPKSNIADYLYYSDAVCLASFNEGLPIFALEALSLGKPIISTPAGGMVDIVHNEINGYLSLDFSSENYAVALNSFFAANFIENENIKKANREKYLENYTIQRCSEKYLNLYV